VKHPATNRADIAPRLEPRRCLAKIAFLIVVMLRSSPFK